MISNDWINEEDGSAVDKEISSLQSFIAHVSSGLILEAIQEHEKSAALISAVAATLMVGLHVGAYTWLYMLSQQ